MEEPARWKTWAGPKNIVYYDHDRTGSAGSTKYCVWDGPSSEEAEVRFATLLPHFCPVNPCTIGI